MNGIVRLGHLGRRASQEALRSSIPSTHAAIRLADAVQRLLADPWVESAPNGSRTIFRTDPARPGWIVPVPVLTLQLDPERAPPSSPTATEPEPAWLPDQRPAVLTLHEGRSTWQVAFDRNGRPAEWIRSAGDDWPDPAADAPWAWDERKRVHGQPRPIGLLLRPDLDPAGHLVEDVARWVTELDVGSPLRLRLPMRAGAVAATRTRALHVLRQAWWERRGIRRQAGWIVVDAIDGRALSDGDTLEEAFARWPASADEVPALAVPVPALPLVPNRLQLTAFSRVLPLTDEHGRNGHVFVRDDRSGFALFGGGLVDHVDPLELDRQLGRARAVLEREAREVWGDERSPLARQAESTWRVLHYDFLGPDAITFDEVPRLGVISHTDTIGYRNWEPGLHWTVVEARRFGG